MTEPEILTPATAAVRLRAIAVALDRDPDYDPEAAEILLAAARYLDPKTAAGTPLESGLALPGDDGALATAGVLCHYITSTPDRLAAFTRWVEHCPGDLDPAEVRAYLGAVHDRLSPACPEPIGVDPRPGRR